MSAVAPTIQRVEFEARIFVSFGIVLAVCGVAFLGFPDTPALLVHAGVRLGLDSTTSLLVGYPCVACAMAIASALRMWAGTVLTSGRVMAFAVQADTLTLAGPYHLVRNPIYLADLVAFCGFAVCLPPIGVALPVLLLLHYTQLVRYEERALLLRFGDPYREYIAEVPSLIPTRGSLRRARAAFADAAITLDGFRHNALYLLFIPGFILAAPTGSLLLAVAIGLPAVLDWAVVHTRKGVTRRPARPAPAGARPHQVTRAGTKVFEGVLYAQCWEDPQIDREALRIRPNDTVFSITSGGDNVLAFLIDDPRRVIALDLNPHQNYLLDLKMAAFATLPHCEVLAFLGATPSRRRRVLYRALRSRLRPDSRAFWDAHLQAIDQGVLHCGRYERYLRLLRWWFGVLMGRSLASDVFAAPNALARQAIFRRRWDTRRWRLLTSALLSRALMTRLFDPSFFAQLEESISFGERFRARIERAVVTLPVERNPFLSYVLLGRFATRRHLPLYLQPRHYEAIRHRVHRIECVTGSCEDYFATLPAGTISSFNFSNIFEWMPPSAVEQVLRHTVRVAQDGAILTYRNLLVPRSRPPSLAQWITPEHQLAASLHQRDLSFIYGAYVVERVTKDEVPCPTPSRS